MSEETIFFGLAICLPALLCITAVFRHLSQVRTNPTTRSLAALACLLPPTALASNAWRILNNDVEFALIYIAPPVVLLFTLVGIISPARLNYTKMDQAVMVLAVLSSGWLATFFYLMTKID